MAVTPTIVRVCAGNYFGVVMVQVFFPAYDFDTVLATISIRLRRKARLGKLGCKSENHITNIANPSKPVLEEAGDVSKSYQNRIEIAT